MWNKIISCIVLAEYIFMVVYFVDIVILILLLGLRCATNSELLFFTLFINIQVGIYITDSIRLNNQVNNNKCSE